MTSTRSIIAALLIASPFAANAATIADGSYEALDYDGYHGIWSPPLAGDTQPHYSLSGSEFRVNGDAAKLVGTATNAVDPALAFVFELEFARSSQSNLGYCQYDGNADPDCDSAFTQNLIATNQVDPSSWDFFELLGGTFTGTDLLAGVTYDISDKSGHQPQVGIGGNAIDTDDLGLSMWFTFMRTDGGPSTIGGYTLLDQGGGDFNIDIASMPLPAAGWLLIAGLGGMFAMGRRNKAA